MVFKPGQSGNPNGRKPRPDLKKRPYTPPRNALIEATLAAAEQALLADDLTALDVMERRMRGDQSITREQYEAAIQLAPYRHPRLSAIAMQPISATDSMTPEQRQRRISELTWKLGPPMIEAEADTLRTHGSDLSDFAQDSRSSEREATEWASVPPAEVGD